MKEGQGMGLASRIKISWVRRNRERGETHNSLKETKNKNRKTKNKNDIRKPA
jgi:hypothetical protein